jgi:hypothetical protein
MTLAEVFDGFIKNVDVETTTFTLPNKVEVDYVTNEFIHKGKPISITEVVEFLPKECLTKFRFFISLNFGKVQSEQEKFVREVVEPFQSNSKSFCLLREIDPQLGEQQGLSEHNGNVIIPYRDIHGRVVGYCSRNPLTGEIQTFELSSNIPYFIGDGKKRNNVLVLLKNEIDPLCFASKLKSLSTQYEIDVMGIPLNKISKSFSRFFNQYRKVFYIGSQTDTNLEKEKLLKELFPEIEHVSLRWSPAQIGSDFTDWIAYPENDFESLVSVLKVDVSHKVIMTHEQLLNVPDSAKEWIIENLFGVGDFVVVGGQQKSRKTFLVLNMLKCLATGENFLGNENFEPNVKANVLFLEAEGNIKDFGDRVTNCIGVNPEFDSRFSWIHRSGIKLTNENEVDYIIYEAKKRNCKLVVIDPLQDFSNLTSENDSTQMLLVTNSIKRIIRDANVCVMVIHHFNGSGSVESGWKSLRGSTALAGAADLGIFISPGEGQKKNVHKIAIDGREFRSIHIEDKKTIKVTFKNYEFNAVTGIEALNEEGVVHGPQLVINYLRQNNLKEIPLKTLANLLNKTIKTISSWVTLSGGALTKTSPSPNNPVMVQLNDISSN